MGLQRLNNPSYRPEGVVEGYQQQNYNMAAARVGLDTTNPFDNGTTITIPIGGVVEVNGVLYRTTSQWSATKPNAGIAYWIAVVPSEDGLTASFDLVTRPGVWSPDRNGCYNADNRRTLNWVSMGRIAEWTANDIVNGVVYSRDTRLGNGTVSLQKGWYFVQIRSGLGGGDGMDAGHPTGGGVWDGGAGGIPGTRRLAEKIFFADRYLYSIKIGGDGGSGLRGLDGGSSGNGGGGGGGSGSGEETVFDGLSTGTVPPGNGGNGGRQGAGNIGGRGGRNGGNGSPGIITISTGTSAIIPGGFGGPFGGGSGGGGGSQSQRDDRGADGGDGGIGGAGQPDGSPGGSCNIWSLGN